MGAGNSPGETPSPVGLPVGGGTPGGPSAGALPGPLVGVEWLAPRLGGPGLVVLDASVGAHRRVEPDAPGGAPRVRDGRTAIPGARIFDIDGALSDRTSPLPHTMPGAGHFTDELRALGVNDTDAVVVYDAVGVYSSARAWWMLRAMGFDRAAVLDGGLPAWTDAGLPVVSDGPEPVCLRGDFTARPRPGLFADGAEVAAALADPGAAVLDARARGRFSGEAAEPRPGLRGGHMPGAANLPFGEIQHRGRMLPAARLRTAFAAAAGGRERLVLSCGSGVTACVLALGAELAGYRDLSVYDGSWSEWGLPSARPVVAGNGPSPQHP
ncbi:MULTISPECIES: sulfurtransferase [unclassified Streptomyces]|uniref:sulfurtransferase n=1 Tax=unclassified Streptomyces TaxID=2593676 RepID=UPI002E1C5F62|nr:sulfurtransferase [Streptomyces sp. NBC_01023]